MDVNFVALLIAGVANMAVGYLWYSKALFANQWMKLAGISQADMTKAKSKMPVTYGTMFVASLVEAYVLSMFIRFTGASDLVSGALVGFWVWLGFIATTMLTGTLFEGRPNQLYYINAGYQLVSMLVMGALLVQFS